MTPVFVEAVRNIKNAMENKRKISILIPYINNLDTISIYLQKRSKDAKVLPDHFGFFGGGLEGNESPEEALRREIKEELNFVPKGYIHFKKYEFEHSVKDIFLFETDSNFEQQVTILEGQYGKWFTVHEAMHEPKLIGEDKLVVSDACEFLRMHKRTETA